MRKVFFLMHVIVCLSILISQNAKGVNEQRVKVLDIEANSVVLEQTSTKQIDTEAIKAIKSIKRITVQVNPLPPKGYLIKIPLTTSVKVKNKWIEDFITEVMLVYNLEDQSQSRLILYNDENSPIFFDIDYDFTSLFQMLKLQDIQSNFIEE